MALFGKVEAAAEARGYRPYRMILSEVVDGFGEAHGFTPSEPERESLAESIRDWPPFADTTAALASLKNRYRLAVISNIDDDLFAYSARKLGVDFRCGGDGPTGGGLQAVTRELCGGVRPIGSGSGGYSACGAESLSRHWARP